MMAKARKTTGNGARLSVKKEQRNLPDLFDMIALVGFLGFAAIAGGGYLLAKDLLYTRSVFVVMMYCLIASGTSYAIGHLMRRNPGFELRYFKAWFGGMIATMVLMILSLGLFY